VTRVRAGAGAALVVWFTLLLASPAGAHATLVSTSPEPGAVLDESPESVSVTFNEPVQTDADSLRVIDASGALVSSTPASSGATVSVDVDTDAQGWFAVSWQIVSEDGHPLTGGWTYRVGDGADVAPEDLQAVAEGTHVYPDTEIALGSAQWVSTLAALVLVGTVFVALVTPTVAAQRAVVPYVVGLGVAGSFFAAGLNGPATTATTDWFDGPASEEYLVRCGLLLVGGVVLWALWERRWARVGAGVLLTAGLCVTVLSGHAHGDGTTTVVLVMAHLVVAGAWLGALPAVVIGAWQGGDAARTTLTRFSRAAVWLAAAVVVLGVAAAWILSGGLGSVAPRWGTLLFVKVGLVVIAVLAGGWTRFNVLREWASRTLRQIRTPLLVEVGLLALIAATSVALTHNGPPEEYVAPGPIQLSVEQDDVVLTLVVDPGGVGSNDVHLYVTDPAGLPLSVEEATVELSSADLGIAPIAQTLSDLGGGHYSGSTDDLGAPGTWEARVVVRPTPFTQVVLEDRFEIE
jgi:copper transport protein